MFYDADMIVKQYFKMGFLFEKYFPKGLKSVSLKELRIVHLPNKMIFRFERDSLQTNGKTINERSLMVFHLK